MRTIIRVRCEDGAEYDQYFIAPKHMSDKKAAKAVDKAIRRYFASSGDRQVDDQLYAKGFKAPHVIDSKETW